MEKDFSLLICEELCASPMTLSELHVHLKKKNLFSRSIQALYKQLKKMTAEKKVSKQHNAYFVSKNWILQNKRFFDSLYQKTARVKNYAALKENYEEYIFDSLFDLDNFWNEAIRRILETETEKKIYSKTHYHWWSIVNMSYELNLWKGIKKRGFKPSFMLLNDTSLNRWWVKILKTNGFNARIVNQKKSAYIDWCILGTTIIQVSYDAKTSNTIRTIFNKYRLIEQIPIKKLTELSTARGHFELRLFKNKALADEMKKKFKST